MVKKIIVALVLVLNFFIVPLSAYEVPEVNYYATVHDSDLGDITIYFPISDYSFSLKDSNIVNIGSSNITGYFTYNGEDYTVTFQPYQFGRYRLNNMTNVYLDITDIYDTNLFFIDPDLELLFSNTELVFLAGLVILVMVVIIK